MRLKQPVRTRGRLWRGSLVVSLVTSGAAIAVLAAVFVWRSMLPH